jgi:hypothetical protein
MMQGRGNRQRGVALGLVLVLLVVVILAAGIAVWGTRSEIGSAGSDRLARQLFDCAERGLAFGKDFFSKTHNAINDFLSTDLCAAGLPCYPNGPFRPVTASPPPCGIPVPGYPSGSIATDANAQLTQTITVGGQNLQFVVAIYDDADEPANPQNYTCDVNNQVIVYSLCRDTMTNQFRTVSAVVQLTGSPTSDYTGQVGHGFRGQGNAN